MQETEHLVHKIHPNLQVFQRRHESVFVGGGRSCTPGENSVAVKHVEEAGRAGAPAAAGRRKRARKGTNLQKSDLKYTEIQTVIIK